MKIQTGIATLALRLALAATFLSSVASRLVLLGEQSSGWENFLAYTAEVNSFAPASAIPFLGVAATGLEIILPLLLIIGYKTRLAAYGASILTLLFAIAMSISFGLKSPLDYSVFVDSAAALLLAAMPAYRWSLDDFLANEKQTEKKHITHHMKERMKIGNVEPRIYKAMDAAERQLSAFDLEPKLMELVKLRVSQLNGCGYCINMHSKDARKLGETEQRLYALSAWWETPFFTKAEQAALKLAEEVTLISGHGVSDEIYANAVECFGEQGTAQLIFAATVTNSWNRLAISTHMVAEQD